MSGFQKALGLALALAFAPVGVLAAPAPDPQPAFLAQDPAVRRGVLPNGLRYAVMTNATPRGAVSLRLAMDVGSFEETDAERGAAHFIEHLAFRATRGFPEGQLDRAFAPMGVAFGRDQNAATSLHATIYQLDLPESTPAHLDLAFRWLRDVADGLTFDPAATDRERGVVLAEKEARNNPSAIAQEELVRFQAPGLRSSQRSPIGTQAVLASITPATLQAFYDRWYRPDAAVIVVTGDLPVEVMEARVKSAFGSWTPRGPVPIRPSLSAGRLDTTRGLDAWVRTDSRVVTSVTACRIDRAAPLLPYDLAALRRRVTRDLWTAALNGRLNEVRLRDPTILGAGMAFSDDIRDGQGACVVVAPTAETWEPALAAVQAEVRRFERDGPNELEFEQAVENQRSALRTAITRRTSRTSSATADSLADRELRGWPLGDARGDLRAFDLAVEDMTPEDVRLAFIRDWSGSGPLLSATAPAPPSRETLMAAWTRNAGGITPGRYSDPTAVVWAYGPLAEPGKIISRESLKDPDFTRVRFRNGVVLNLKKTNFETGAVAVRIVFGAGRREIPNDAFMTANVAAGMFSAGGVGRHSREELVSLFGSNGPDFQLGVSDYAFVLRQSASSANLIYSLRVLATYLQDPGFRDSLDSRIPTAIDLVYRSYRTNLMQVLRDATAKKLAPGSPVQLPPPEKIRNINSRDFAAVLRPAVTQAPLEITLVGDLDEADAIDKVARTFGVLPTRRTGDRGRSDTFFMRYPAQPPPEIQATHDGPVDKAAVGVIWPLYVATPARRREEYALRLLASIFADELRHVVRERLGKTYSPMVYASTPDDADQGEMMAVVETYPADLDTVRDEVRAVAARLAAGEITSQMLEAARKPDLAEVRTSTQTNGWWASALTGSANYGGQGLRDAMAYQEMIEALTLTDIRAAAATWLSRPPIVVTARPAGAPEATQ